jgi:hypothetical protein
VQILYLGTAATLPALRNLKVAAAASFSVGDWDFRDFRYTDAVNEAIQRTVENFRTSTPSIFSVQAGSGVYMLDAVHAGLGDLVQDEETFAYRRIGSLGIRSS